VIYLGLALKFWRESIMAIFIVLFCVASALYVQRGHRINEIKAEAVEARVQFEARQREIESKNYERVINAVNQAEIQTRVNEQHAISANVANDSLRDTIGQLQREVSQVSAEAAAKYTQTFGDVLGECTAKYIDLARKADGHARDSEMIYKAWPKN
jgi:hypothetical protein